MAGMGGFILLRNDRTYPTNPSFPRQGIGTIFHSAKLNGEYVYMLDRIPTNIILSYVDKYDRENQVDNRLLTNYSEEVYYKYVEQSGAGATFTTYTWVPLEELQSSNPRLFNYLNRVYPLDTQVLLKPKVYSSINKPGETFDEDSKFEIKINYFREQDYYRNIEFYQLMEPNPFVSYSLPRDEHFSDNHSLPAIKESLPEYKAYGNYWYYVGSVDNNGVITYPHQVYYYDIDKRITSAAGVPSYDASRITNHIVSNWDLKLFPRYQTFNKLIFKDFDGKVLDTWYNYELDRYYDRYTIEDIPLDEYGTRDYYKYKAGLTSREESFPNKIGSLTKLPILIPPQFDYQTGRVDMDYLQDGLEIIIQATRDVGGNANFYFTHPARDDVEYNYATLTGIPIPNRFNNIKSSGELTPEQATELCKNEIISTDYAPIVGTKDYNREVYKLDPNFYYKGTKDIISDDLLINDNSNIDISRVADTYYLVQFYIYVRAKTGTGGYTPITRFIFKKKDSFMKDSDTPVYGFNFPTNLNLTGTDKWYISQNSMLGYGTALDINTISFSSYGNTSYSMLYDYRVAYGWRVELIIDSDIAKGTPEIDNFYENLKNYIDNNWTYTEQEVRFVD